MSEDFDYTGKEELEQQEMMPFYNRNIANQLMRVIKPGQSLLDFGAGTGTISELVRDNAKAESITCLEIDKGNIAMLEQRGFNVVDDIAKVPDNSIDVTYSSNVLEHIEDDVAAMKDVYAKLKPGGYAAYWVPAWQILWTKMDERVHHFRRYHRKGLIDVFEKAGFEVERCYFQDCLGFPVTILFKLIGNKDAKVTDGNLKLYNNVIFPVSHVMDYCARYFIGKNLVIHGRKKA